MLQPLSVAGQAARFTLQPVGDKPAAGAPPTNVTLFDQGLIQVLEASVTGLEPMHPYVLALAAGKDGSGALEPLTNFMTNPAGAAIVNALGPIRQIVQGSAAEPGKPVQVQAPEILAPESVGYGPKRTQNRSNPSRRTPLPRLSQREINCIRKGRPNWSKQPSQNGATLGPMSDGAFIFFAITLGTVSAALAAVLVFSF